MWIFAASSEGESDPEPTPRGALTAGGEGTFTRSFSSLRESPLLRALAAGLTATAILASAAVVSSFVPVRVARD